jgi:hypothetical protein
MLDLKLGKKTMEQNQITYLLPQVVLNKPYRVYF